MNTIKSFIQLTVIVSSLLLTACAEGEDVPKKAINSESTPAKVETVAKTSVPDTSAKESVKHDSDVPAKPMIMLDTYVEGKDYTVLPVPIATEVGDGEIEVREFFWYSCGHCFNAEKYLPNWKSHLADNVKFIPTPAIFRPDNEVMAKGYYIAKGLNILDKTHEPLFNRFHVDRKPVTTIEQLRSFFKQYGVDSKTFDAANESPLILAQLDQASKIVRAYKISGVPTFAINGKYLTSASMVGSNQKALQVVDYLVNKEQKLIKKK